MTGESWSLISSQLSVIISTSQFAGLFFEMHSSGKPCAMAAMDAEENISTESMARGVIFAMAAMDAAEGNISTESMARGVIFGIAPSHIIYNDSHLIAGLSSYPITTGHAITILRQSAIDVFSLETKQLRGGYASDFESRNNHSQVLRRRPLCACQ